MLPNLATQRAPRSKVQLINNKRRKFTLSKPCRKPIDIWKKLIYQSLWQRPRIIDQNKLLTKFVIVLTNQSRYKNLKPWLVYTRQRTQSLLTINNEPRLNTVRNRNLNVYDTITKISNMCTLPLYERNYYGIR